MERNRDQNYRFRSIRCLWDKLPLSFVYFYIPFEVNYAMNINAADYKIHFAAPPKDAEAPYSGFYVRHPVAFPFLPELLEIKPSPVFIGHFQFLEHLDKPLQVYFLLDIEDSLL